MPTTPKTDATPPRLLDALRAVAAAATAGLSAATTEEALDALLAAEAAARSAVLEHLGLEDNDPAWDARYTLALADDFFRDDRDGDFPHR